MSKSKKKRRFLPKAPVCGRFSQEMAPISLEFGSLKQWNMEEQFESLEPLAACPKRTLLRYPA